MPTPTIEGISGWYRSSQIEYFTPFMKLWLSFNAWYKQKYNAPTDRDAIEELKNYQDIKDRLQQLFKSDANEAREFRKYLGELIVEIRNECLVDSGGANVDFTNTDLYKNRRRLANSTIESKIRRGEPIVKLDDGLAIASDINVIIRELLEVIYQIRNYLIHGNFEINNKRAQLLVKNGYLILNNLFKPIIGGP
ncbi:hypothetical protein A3K64_04085 [Candidatus Micrarchaeota archaeon RBG_16_36_9]|nr:MAG: hypothetical protein A3K64_04085 [Candidatus Micrarchaeota archaeon RBG_16_36_9]